MCWRTRSLVSGNLISNNLTAPTWHSRINIKGYLAITLGKTLTEERVSALRRLVGEATNAIARSDKRKCIAKRYIVDLSKRILKERGELEEGTEDLKTLVRKLGIKLKGEQ